MSEVMELRLQGDAESLATKPYNLVMLGDLSAN